MPKWRKLNWNPILLESNASIRCSLYTLVYIARYQLESSDELSQGNKIIYTKYPEMAFLLLVILGSIYRERMGLSWGLICVEPLGLCTISVPPLLFLFPQLVNGLLGFSYCVNQTILATKLPIWTKGVSLVICVLPHGVYGSWS